uniref:Down syndrome cell adhesion molecule-like protein Dscam2 n=1 Tax=Strigamia maritima TaxID=126957 RepID=T1JAC9_STRMM
MHRNVKIGDVVLIQDENQPRSSWQMGQVEQTFLGRDNKVRSCEIRLSTGKVEAPALTSVELHGPVFIQEPTNHVDFSNTTGARVECTAHGTPLPAVQWLLADGSPASDVPTVRVVYSNGTLAFLPFPAEGYRQDVHAAIYRCRASNSVGAILSRDVRIRAVVMQMYEVQVYNEFVIRGNTAVLKCHIPSFVTDYVKVMSWVRDTTFNVLSEVETGGRYTIMPTGELHIREVGPSDAYHSFRCRTIHRLTGEIRISSMGGKLVISDPQGSVTPRITDSKTLVQIHKGEAALLPCAAQGYPAPTYSWYVKSNRSQMNSLVLTDRIKQIGGSLLIQNARIADGKTYVCVVSSNVGNQSAVTVLSVTVPLSAYIQPHKLKVDVGSSAVLNCKTSGYPVASLVWLKDAQLVRPQPHPPHSLHIETLRREQRGMYQCMASNDHEAAQGTAELRLGDAASDIVEGFQERVLSPGTSTSLRCVASGNPAPQMMWMLDDTPLVNSLHTELVSAQGEVVSYLNLTGVRTQDGGDYTCLASNRLGNSSHTSRLNILGPPGIRPMSRMSVVAGFDVTLKCRVYGHPLESLSWEKDGLLLPVNRRQKLFPNGTLAIQNIQKTIDGGKYACVVRGVTGEAVRKDMEITVMVPPKISPFSFQDEDLYEGMRAQVTCAVRQGDLPMAIHWMKDGVPIEATSLGRDGALVARTFDVYTSSLSIDSVASEHNGNYTCVASNMAAAVTYSSSLRVNAPPVLASFSFPSVGIHEGMVARVTCSVTQGDLPIYFHWAKDGRQIASGEGIAIKDFDEYASILTINDVRHRHTGRYTCIANNAAASIKHSTHLIVHVPPRWLVEPKDTQVLVGASARMDCQADGYPEPSITWTKALPSDYREILGNGGNVNILQNGSLILSSIREVDRGYYSCQANSKVGEGLSKVFFLDVHVPVQFEVRSRNQTAKRGENVRLQCNAKGDSPIKVTWSVNSHPIEPAARPRYKIKEMSSKHGFLTELIVTRSERSDSGVYSCSATNPHGRDSTVIHLTIQEPPEAPRSVNVEDYDARSVNLAWLQPYDGNSQVAKYIVQYKHVLADWIGGSANETVIGRVTSAVVSSLLPATKYAFRVMAENEVGVSEPSETVVISTAEEAPSAPPTHILIEATQPQCLKVSWKAPQKDLWHGEILGYNVGYKMQDSSKPFLFKAVESASLDGGHLELRGLLPFTKYDIVVQAYNRVGPGPLSDAIGASSAEEVPSRAPDDVRCSAHSSQSVHVTWAPPSPQSVNGILQGYKLLFREIHEQKRHQTLGHDNSIMETKITPSLETILHGLAKFQNYSIQVLAFTRVGDGVKSDVITCQTFEDVPESPEKVKALVASEDSILLTWLPPSQPNGIIIRYTVYIRTIDKDKENTTKMIVSGSQLSYDFKGLVKNHRYEFWVTSSTSIGEGQSTKMVSVTLTSKVAAKIVSFGASIVIAWKEDVHVTCDAVGIPPPTRVWNVGGQPLPQLERYQVQPDGSLLVRNVQLTDSGNYSCRVENGHGSDINFYIILVQAPPVPPHVAVSSATSSSVTIHWKPGPDGGSAITGYSLTFKRDYAEWEEIQLNADRRSHVLNNLWCGSRYQLYMSAANVIGAGEPSEIASIKTKGSAPSAPAKEQLIYPNAEFVALNLNTWDDGGCAILYFIIEYKAKSSPDWVLVSNNVKPQRDAFLIPDLESRVSYNVRITAHNSAGSQTEVYDFATRGRSDIAQDDKSDMDEEDQAPFYADLKLIVPIASAILGLLVIFATYALCISFRRNKLHDKNESENYSQPEKDVGSSLAHEFDKNSVQTPVSTRCNYLQQEFDHFPGSLAAPTRPKLNYTQTSLEDVCPYATYRIPESSNKAQVHTSAWHQLPLKTQDFLSGGREKRDCGKQTSSNKNFSPQVTDQESTNYQNPITSCDQINHQTSSNYPITSPNHRQVAALNLEANIPDLLYHGTESSTSNDTSPDLEWGMYNSMGRNMKFLPRISAQPKFAAIDSNIGHDHGRMFSKDVTAPTMEADFIDVMRNDLRNSRV